VIEAINELLDELEGRYRPAMQLYPDYGGDITGVATTFSWASLIPRTAWE